MKILGAFVAGCVLTALILFALNHTHQTAYDEALRTLKTQTNQTQPGQAIQPPQSVPDMAINPSEQTTKVKKSPTALPGASQARTFRPAYQPNEAGAATQPVQQQTSAPVQEVVHETDEPAVVPTPPIRYGTIRPPTEGHTVRTTIFVILAGQELSLSNTVFDSIVIYSDLPIVARIGQCEDTNTEKITCTGVDHNEPILIQDLRTGYPPDSSQRNHIQIEGIEN